MLKFIAALLKFIIFNISRVLNRFLGNIFGLPSLIHMIMRQVADIATAADGTHLFADSERALRVR